MKDFLKSIGVEMVRVENEKPVKVGRKPVLLKRIMANLKLKVL